ncbi:MAG: radical SAM protein [Candidatus Nealsonbacteria bacterium]
MEKIKIPSKQIRLILNWECNAKCSYCWKECQDDFSRSIKDYELWQNFLSQLFKNVEYIERISLSGGEPLLFSYLPEICEICSTYAKRVTLTTNGSIPSMVDRVARHIDEIHFSVDSLDKKKYKKIKGLNIDKVLESIKIAKERRLKIRINTVMNDGLISLQDIKNLQKFCRGNKLTLSLVKPFLAESNLLKQSVKFFESQGYKKKEGKRRFILKNNNDEIQVVYCICDWVLLFNKEKEMTCMRNNSLFINYKFEALPCLLDRRFTQLFDFKNKKLLIQNLRSAIKIEKCLVDKYVRNRRAI